MGIPTDVLLAPVSGALLVLAGIGTDPVTTGVRWPVTTAAVLVFDKVTVVDVEQGKLLPAQRVVIIGNRIRAVGAVGAVKTPAGARIVDAQGQYLIPGLWDLHIHPNRSTDIFYPLYLANGVTGVRDAGSGVPLDTLRRWRREILAGTRVGPPRQVLSGPSINKPDLLAIPCDLPKSYAACIGASDSVAMRRLVDSLKMMGADMIKLRALTKAMYFVMAAEARRVGIPFGGHHDFSKISVLEAADSGASILDHLVPEAWSGCLGEGASVDRCRPVADRLRQNRLGMVPDLREAGHPMTSAIFQHVLRHTSEFWAGALLHGNWLRDSVHASFSLSPKDIDSGGPGVLRIMHQVGLPILAGTDEIGSSGKDLGTSKWGLAYRSLPGFGVHAQLAKEVAEGLTPLSALQSATLNPAIVLRATDSLGTVAPGKLADLVLLDADPLADITNTTTVRAVVANGRYFDRAALDRLLSGVQAKVRHGLQLPVAALAGQRVAVLPPSTLSIHVKTAQFGDPDANRAWIDSTIGTALARRVPKVSWVLPAAMREIFGRSPGTPPIDGHNAWGLFSYERGKDVPARREDLMRQLRQLAAAAGARVVLLPTEAAVMPIDDRPNAVVVGRLTLLLVDTGTGTVIWQDDIISYGDTPESAFDAVLMTVLPRARAGR